MSLVGDALCFRTPVKSEYSEMQIPPRRLAKNSDFEFEMCVPAAPSVLSPLDNPCRGGLALAVKLQLD